MKLTFIKPTNRMCIIDDKGGRREVSAVEEVWMWDVDNSDYLHIYGEDSDYLEGIEVSYGKDNTDGRRNRIYLIPYDETHGIQINPDVLWPDRIDPIKVGFDQIFEDKKWVTAFVRETPVGMQFVTYDKEEAFIDVNKVFISEADTGIMYPITKFYHNMDRWCIYSIQRDGAGNALINDVKRIEYKTPGQLTLENIVSDFIYGKKEHTDSEIDIANIVLNISGLWNIDRVPLTVENVLESFNRLLSGGSPDGHAAYVYHIEVSTIIGVFAGSVAARYINDTVYRDIGSLYISLDENGKACVMHASGKTLREVAYNFYGIKSDELIGGLISSASVCC